MMAEHLIPCDPFSGHLLLFCHRRSDRVKILYGDRDGWAIWYNRCKDPRRPHKHGPYYQLSFTWRGKSSSRFVRREQVPEMRRKLAHYKRFRELVNRWVDLEVARERTEREIGKWNVTLPLLSNPLNLTSESDLSSLLVCKFVAAPIWVHRTVTAVLVPG
jgi:hypothetical protein